MNSKAKGGEYERKCCKELSLWLTGGTRDDVLWRAAMSGGRASVQFKKGRRHESGWGDISSIDPASAPFIAAFYIECRFYKDLSIVSSLISSKGKLHSFWAEVVEQSQKAKRLPFFIAKQNRVPPLILLSTEGVHKLSLDHIHPTLSVCWTGWMVHIFAFDELLREATPPG